MIWSMEFKQRTLQQNKSLHKYCELLADALNEAGISQALFLKGLEVDNSSESVKVVFRAIGKAKYLKISTVDLTTKEMSEIFDEINRHIALLGIHIDWPSEESQNFSETYNHK